MSAIDPAQRARLNAVKLGALVRDTWGVEGDVRTVGTSALLVGGGAVHVLADGELSLGSALAVAAKGGGDKAVRLVVDDSRAGVLARQAEYFRTDITVWRTSGRSLDPVGPSPLPSHGAPPDAPELVGMLHAAGLEVVVEGDRIGGEWLGLELARIFRDDDGVPGIAVGVGRFDRELTAMLHGELSPTQALDRVVEQVRRIRHVDAPTHPLRDLVPERWLRARLVADPARIGCEDLVAGSTVVPRDSLRERGIAVATGTRGGDSVVVATAVGVYLDAVPEAADARAMLDPAASLLVVTPARDALAPLRAAVDDLVDPAELVAVDDDWR